MKLGGKLKLARDQRSFVAPSCIEARPRPLRLVRQRVGRALQDDSWHRRVSNMKNPPCKAGSLMRLAMTMRQLASGLCRDRREGFLCEILVEVANLGCLSDERFERRLGVLSRQFQELLRRLHASELFKVRLVGLKRRLRIVGLGGGDGSQVLLDAGKINHWNSLFSHGAVPVVLPAL